MEQFSVPKRVVEQIGQGTTPETASQGTPSKFVVPDQVIQDIGKVAGDSSDANQLLSHVKETPLDESSGEDKTEPDPAEEWLINRNQELASRDFSFTRGETMSLYDQLSPRRQRKVLAIRDKMLEKYAERGVVKENIGLIYDNDIRRYLRRNGGAVMGFAEDEYYLAILGKPLSNLRVGNHLESKSSHIRYRGKKYRILNYHAMNSEQRPAPPRATIPMLDEGEWLPIVKVLSFPEA